MKNKFDNKIFLVILYFFLIIIISSIAFTINNDKLINIISVINQHKDFLIALFEIIKIILEILKVYFEIVFSS